MSSPSQRHSITAQIWRSPSEHHSIVATTDGIRLHNLYRCRFLGIIHITQISSQRAFSDQSSIASSAVASLP
ncbi:proline-rich receptor-like protein kinase PERK2 [Iris pallida]|uniref:Proline-rich receptor-like protein kinase PERK2 n=1 Tax=Iris pallida TaxID=29817 RepID=A0AAX6FGS1_IRIPA|nr:proline-rich receptor-like protein kinase PERK2 [Iris pallida]KAJ6834097.1 proline-rich receptor-like protein kinase PERK2 [Iris pallida]